MSSAPSGGHKRLSMMSVKSIRSVRSILADADPSNKRKSWMLHGACNAGAPFPDKPEAAVTELSAFTEKPPKDPTLKLASEPDWQDGEDVKWPSAAWYILVVEFCERLAFYGASIVFYPYMQNMLEMTQGTANAIYNAFNFWAYASCLIGGFVADTYAGKVQAILIFAVTYTIGLAVLFFSATPMTWDNFPHDPSDGMAIPGFAVSLFFIGLGMGGIKSNVSTLMADQLGDCPPKAYTSVFRWFYWSINLGALVGILVSPVLHEVVGEKKQTKEDPGETDGTAYWASYLMPLGTFFIAIAIFMIGKVRGLFIDRPPTGSLLLDCWRAARHALSMRSEARACGREVQVDHWLDWAKDSPIHATNARDLKMALRSCVVFLFYPVYWLVYNQLFSNLVSQADLLDRPSWVAAEALNVLGSLTLIIIIPILDKIIFPLLQQCGWNPSPIRRITIGFALASLSMFYAGGLEYFILQRGHFNENDDYVLDDPNGKRLAIWWQIPPYVITGVSEVFASVGGLEFSYAEAPKSMKSVIMSFFLLTNAVGSLIGIAISPAVKPQNMNVVFMSIGGTMLFIAIVFHFLFRNRRANYDLDADEEENEELP